MITLLQDLRYASRVLLKTPGVTVAAALSLTLGIGANATIFSWVKAVLLEPLPGVAEQERLVVVASRSRGGRWNSLSYPDYLDFGDRNRVFDGILVQTVTTLNIGAAGAADRPERLYASVVSGNFFEVLGVRAALGRTFLPEEDRTPDSHPVVVISHGLWQRRFGADPTIVDRSVLLNNRPFTVIGIMPPVFQGTYVGLVMDAWVPIMMQEQVLPGARLQQRDGRWMQALARLKPDVRIEQAEADIQAIARQIALAYPATNEGRGAGVLPLWRSPWGAQVILAPVLLVLTGVVAVVLLLACANVANMLLARALGRRREVAIRLSLGAARGRLMRQLLTESVVLASIGGVCGLAVAAWSADLMGVFLPPTDMPVMLTMPIDRTVLGFTAVVAIMTGLVFGLAPALQASNPNVVAALKDDGGTASGGRARSRLRSLLVIGQVALSVLLLVGAGLFLRSVEMAQRISPGFNPDRLALAGYDLFPNGYTE
ncbi:MAG: ABC transporter permease, partial [Acidobacteria bacterium]|nr:ABC transporter permease [Acidobacteriota bacterium]